MDVVALVGIGAGAVALTAHIWRSVLKRRLRALAREWARQAREESEGR
jgi:hypothetical protein